MVHDSNNFISILSFNVHLKKKKKVIFKIIIKHVIDSIIILKFISFFNEHLINSNCIFKIIHNIWAWF
jgi:hypothetical protein